MRILLSTLALLCAPALADSIARQGNDYVRLTLKPCENVEAVAQVKSAGEDPLSFRAAFASFGGQDFHACWRPMGGGAWLVYPDGDRGFVPMGDLRPAPEA